MEVAASKTIGIRHFCQKLVKEDAGHWPQKYTLSHLSAESAEPNPAPADARRIVATRRQELSEGERKRTLVGTAFWRGLACKAQRLAGNARNVGLASKAPPKRFRSWRALLSHSGQNA
jgi:hypothetical protein